MPSHASPHPLAGQDTRVASGAFEHWDVAVVDWFDRVAGLSWRHAPADRAAHAYAFRAAYSRLPCDDEVVLALAGNGPDSVLLHDSELLGPRLVVELRP